MSIFCLALSLSLRISLSLSLSFGLCHYVSVSLPWLFCECVLLCVVMFGFLVLGICCLFYCVFYVLYFVCSSAVCVSSPSSDTACACFSLYLVMVLFCLLYLMYCLPLFVLSVPCPLHFSVHRLLLSQVLILHTVAKIGFTWHMVTTWLDMGNDSRMSKIMSVTCIPSCTVAIR